MSQDVVFLHFSVTCWKPVHWHKIANAPGNQNASPEICKNFLPTSCSLLFVHVFLFVFVFTYELTPDWPTQSLKYLNMCFKAMVVEEFNLYALISVFQDDYLKSLDKHS